DDGRAALRKSNKRYDVIVVDAYRQPYVPFHLATVEYYSELKTHLTERGVIAINAARTPKDARLVNAIASTLHEVFPTVLLMDYPDNTNTIVLAAAQDAAPEDYRARMGALQEYDLREIAKIAIPHTRRMTESGLVFTDD